MKLIDIVTQLQAILPGLTDELTDTVSVASITHASGVATITTSGVHSLSVGESTNVLGAITPVTIASIVHVAGELTAIVTTTSDHDYTLYSSYTDGNLAVLSGATEAEFNGTFAIVGVTNRRVFSITVAAGDPTSVTGSPVCDNGSNVFNTVRGQYSVATVPTTTTLTVAHGGASLSLGALTGTMTLRSNPRITGAVSDEAAVAAYSRRIDAPGTKTPKTWIFVVLDDSTVSRGRTSRVDAVDVQTITTAWQQYILQPFSLLLALPAANDTLGRNARDTAEDLLRPILRTVCGNRFPTGLNASLCGPAQFVSHAFARYDGSVYWHDFQFEQRAEMTLFDTVEAGDDVAFRDITLTLTPDLDATQGAGLMTTDIDLDDVPL
jgi:hypothetical protein